MLRHLPIYDVAWQSLSLNLVLRFALYVIHLIVRAGFSICLVLMYSGECTLVCCIYIFTVSLQYLCNEHLLDFRRLFLRQRRRFLTC